MGIDFSIVTLCDPTRHSDEVVLRLVVFIRREIEVNTSRNTAQNAIERFVSGI